MRTKTTTAECATTTRLVNSRNVTLQLYLEPWGEVYEMPPGAVYEALARGPAGDALEVTFADDSITVWGWPGATVTLFHEGMELGTGAGPRSPVPPMPPLAPTAATAPKRKQAAG